MWFDDPLPYTVRSVTYLTERVGAYQVQRAIVTDSVKETAQVPRLSTRAAMSTLPHLLAWIIAQLSNLKLSYLTLEILRNE